MDVSMSSSSNSTIVIHHKLHDLSHPKVRFGIKKWKMDVHPDGSKLPITATSYHSPYCQGSRAVCGATLAAAFLNGWISRDQSNGITFNN